MKQGLGVKAFTALGLALALGTGTWVATSTVAADDDHDDGPVFTERSIRGTWGWSGDGTLVSPDADPVPTAGMGTTTFDGFGGCSVTSTVNINGTPLGPITSQECTYTVNADGTGSSVAIFSSPEFTGEAPVAFVIVDRKKEIRFVQLDEFVVTFVARKL